MERARMLFGCYRRGDANDPETMTAPIRSQSELLDAIRARRDELNISHETIDNIAGFQAGYTSNCCAPADEKPRAHVARRAARCARDGAGRGA
jgi:hypothetical protein